MTSPRPPTYVIARENMVRCAALRAARPPSPSARLRVCPLGRLPFGWQRWSVCSVCSARREAESETRKPGRRKKGLPALRGGRLNGTLRAARAAPVLPGASVWLAVDALGSWLLFVSCSSRWPAQAAPEKFAVSYPLRCVGVLFAVCHPRERPEVQAHPRR